MMTARAVVDERRERVANLSDVVHQKLTSTHVTPCQAVKRDPPSPTCILFIKQPKYQTIECLLFFFRVISHESSLLHCQMLFEA